MPVNGHDQVKIRLAQIDAPESDQAFGTRSQQSLSAMVFGKDVSVDVVVNKDRYRRTVGTVYIDGTDANEEQVRKGMAWAYRQYLKDQSLLKLEDQARQARLGLWSDPNPVPPWEFRHGH